MDIHSAFKDRLVRREPLLGAFIKTPHPTVIEIMARTGHDFLVIDAEHAHFGRAEIDMMMIAGRAVGCPLIVRVPVDTPDWVLNVLDAGAAGVMVPHVNTPDHARRLAKSISYLPGGPGSRGFAGTTRAADYAGRSMAEHLAKTPAETVLICQIEDPEGAQNHAEIAAVDGVDALFVGRADLAVGTGRQDFFDPQVIDLADRILRSRGAATGLYAAPGEDLAPFLSAGASLFVVGSDHTAMRRGAALDRAALDSALDRAQHSEGN